ncbi:MAG TPA: response regulator transcription factor [Candidatus Paenibacillus intestinavium]|nr:response regulator transcription factor [Candidatus Paenibacillus intestinavium]
MAGEIILIVEDEIGIRELIQLYLQKNGYHVLTASDGVEALMILEREQPRLILLDIEMPRMDGFELCRQVRAKLTLPIIYLSSRRGVTDKLKCFELGGDDYITKPFDFSELKARIEANLRRYRQFGSDIEQSSDILKYGQLEIDLNRCQFKLNGEPVELSVKEAQLLMLFVQHPNQVWSAEQLYDHIWGLESTGNIETVKVHISNLRRKLDKDLAHSQYIRTVRGFGYLFAK